MDKLKVGVVIEEDYFPEMGGGFTYSQAIIHKLDQFEFDEKIEICFVSKNGQKQANFKKEVINLPVSYFRKKRKQFFQNMITKMSRFLSIQSFNFLTKVINLLDEINKDVEKHLRDNKIDVLYYVSPNYYPYNYPYIMTHWDLGHKSTFAFPEVSMNSEYHKREYYHRIQLNMAFAIFVESEHSKKELVYYERINPDRIFVIPIFPGRIVQLNVAAEKQTEILNSKNLISNQFFFYPAQFWSLKNHYGLIEAFALIADEFPEMKVVFCGSDKGNLIYIKNHVKARNLQERVIFAGFASEEEVYTFYKNATSLVFPTYLGPTNMPTLEAFYLGCPVICSHLEGHKEQLGGYADYFDPANFEEIAAKMKAVIAKPKSNVSHSYDDSQTATRINQSLLKIYNTRKAFGFDYL